MQPDCKAKPRSRKPDAIDRTGTAMNRSDMFVATALAATLAVGAGTLAGESEEGQQDRVVLQNPGDVEEVVVLGQFIPGDKRITSEVANMLGLRGPRPHDGYRRRCCPVPGHGPEPSRRQVRVRARLGRALLVHRAGRQPAVIPGPVPEDRAARHRPDLDRAQPPGAEDLLARTCRAISVAAR